MLRRCVMMMAMVLASVSAELLQGEFKTLQHDVAGKVYAKDEKTIVIYNFQYDGNGPDAFFWIGKTGTPANTDESMTYILSEDGNYEYRDQSAPKLGAYSGETVTLTLPEGWKMSDVKWISVWCRQFSVNFGELVVADNFKAPVAGEPGSPSSIPEPEHSPVDTNDIDGGSYPEPESEPESEPEPETEPEPYNSATSLVSSGLAMAALLMFSL